MEDNIFIKPGHYCSQDTINVDNKNIIKILGPIGDGRWLDADNKVYSEFELAREWVRLDTVQNQEYQNSRNTELNRLMKGFEPTNYQQAEQVEQIPVNQTQQSIKIEPTQFVQTAEVYVPPVPQVPIVDEFAEIRLLLDKASISTLNKNSMNKFGVEPYKQLVFPITIDVPFDYDVNKLRTIIDLFDLDYNKVIDYLLSEIEVPQAYLRQALFGIINSQEQLKTLENSEQKFNQRVMSGEFDKQESNDSLNDEQPNDTNLPNFNFNWFDKI